MNEYERNSRVQQAHEFAQQGRVDEALQWFLMAEAHEDAVELLKRNQRFQEAGHLLLSQLGIPPTSPEQLPFELKQQVAQAAHLLFLGGDWPRAAELYLELQAYQHVEKLFALCVEEFTKISQGDPAYRDASSALIGVCVVLNRITSVVEFILKQYLQTGPLNDFEAEDFYALAILYLNQQQPNQARPLLYRIRAYHPAFRDVPQIIAEIDGRF